MNPSAATFPSTSLGSLREAQAGFVHEVARIDATGPDAVRLKRMGICVGHEVQVVQAGDPLILQVVGSRVGLSRRLAAQVRVR